MDYLVFLIFRFWVVVLRHSPWFLIYRLSDCMYYILFYVIKYRRKVAVQNLEKIFPEESKAWKFRILQSFYRNLSDIFLESLKGYGMSAEELLSRFQWVNPEKFHEIREKYPRIIVASAHCGNWEWGAMAAPLMMTHRTYGLYKPISNAFIDRWIRQRRAAQGMHLVPIAATSSMFHTLAHQAAYFFITDQHPSKRAHAIWVKFFGYPTAWLHGVEKYARLYELPVFYFGIRRVGRGRYEVFIHEMALQPSALPHGEITRIYVKLLEKIIQEDPPNWLWTHRRWKYEPLADDKILD